MAVFFIAGAGVALSTLIAAPISAVTYFLFSKYSLPIYLVNIAITTVIGLKIYNGPLRHKTGDNDNWIKFGIYMIACISYPVILASLYGMYNLGSLLLAK
jgi:hypothetical protein